MLTSLVISLAALAVVAAVAAALRGYFLLVGRLARIERLQRELNEALTQLADKADIRLRRSGGEAPTPFPAPLRLRRADLAARRPTVGEPEEFGGLLREVLRSAYLPAAGVVIAVVAAFAFFLSSARRGGEDRAASVAEPAVAEAPAKPASAEKPAEPSGEEIKPPSQAGAPAKVVSPEPAPATRRAPEAKTAKPPAAKAPSVAQSAPRAPEPRVTVAASTLRARPSDASRALGAVPEFARVRMLRPAPGAPGWAEVEWGGRRGFLRAELLAEAEPAFP